LPDLKKAEEKSPKPLPHKRGQLLAVAVVLASQHHFLSISARLLRQQGCCRLCKSQQHPHYLPKSL